MEEEVDPAVIKATQISLGKFVKRPPLSDKLLRKPPFRFLHDIVTSVLKSNGFFDGLFEENELSSDNVKDRESKIYFLNKVISVLSLTTGESLTVKPSKIVAGQEPTKTNELLQCLARALDQNLSSEAAVKQFKSGVKIPSSSDKKSKEHVRTVKKNIDTKKSSEKLVIKEKTAPSIKSKHKEDAVHKKESPPKKLVSKVSNKKPTEKSKQELPQQRNDSIKKHNKLSANKTNILENKSDRDTELKSKSNDDNAALDQNSSLDENNLQLDANVQEQSIITINNQENQVDVEDNIRVLQTTSVDQYMSANKDPDELVEIKKELNTKEDVLVKSLNSERKVNVEENKKNIRGEDASVTEVFKDNLEENRFVNGNTHDKSEMNSATVLVRPSSVRPSSSRPGAPRLRDKSDIIISDPENILVGKVNIISENTLQEEEDEETSIIVENQTEEELQEILQNQDHNSLVNNQNSHLVQQILDSQKEYSQVSGKTEIEWQFGVQKTADVFIQEMEQMKFNVQALSRIANPLGKLLDHIQEDVEVMRQELQQWTKSYEETSKDLIKQKTANEEALIPFHTKIKQLTMDIAEKREKITDLKVSIHKNASRIDKLLANGNVQ